LDHHLFMKVYVGNLAQGTTQLHLQSAFQSFGPVAEIVIVEGAATSQSRGFGFVSMSSSPDAQAAITALHGSELGGQRLTVAAAMLPSTGFRRPTQVEA
jgi:RNA recognition motif-containing protein